MVVSVLLMFCQPVNAVRSVERYGYATPAVRYDESRCIASLASIVVCWVFYWFHAGVTELGTISWKENKLQKRKIVRRFAPVNEFPSDA
jgi:hypothetical protein